MLTFDEPPILEDVGCESCGESLQYVVEETGRPSKGETGFKIWVTPHVCQPPESGSNI